MHNMCAGCYPARMTKAIELSLDTCTDPHYLIGRLLRIAAIAGQACGGPAGRRKADALYRGRRKINQTSISELLDELQKDMAVLGGPLGAAIGDAFADFEARLGESPVPEGADTAGVRATVHGWDDQGRALRVQADARG